MKNKITALIWDMIDVRRLDLKEVDYDEIAKEVKTIVNSMEDLASDIEMKCYMI